MASIHTGQRLLTWADYLRLPDDGQRHEVINGVHHVSPAPQPGHQRSVVRISTRIEQWIEASGDDGLVFVSPIDVILQELPDRVTTVQPDVVYLRGIKRSLVTDRGIEGAPDLVIETLSPRTSAWDLGEKRSLYERCTIPEYWIVDRDARTVLQLRLDGAFYREVGRFGVGDTVSTPLLPGFELSVDDATLRV
ncbi:MAG: Uma2 family endonuclease [Planctomycetota bacterium]